MFIYSTRDTSSGDLDISKNFGFFYSDWTPKLAAKVIADFAGGQLPEPPERRLVDAAVEFVRAIINTTERVIRAGAQLFSAAVDVTVQVINRLIDAGVRVVKGLANAKVAVISGVVDAIGRVVGPEGAVTAAMAAQRAPQSFALVSAAPPADYAALATARRRAVTVDRSAPVDVDAKSGTTSAPDAGTVVTDRKSAATQQDNDAAASKDEPDSTGSATSTPSGNASGATTPDAADPSTTKGAATASPKRGDERTDSAGASKTAGNGSVGAPDDQGATELKKQKKM